MSKIAAEEEKDLDRVSNNESDLDRVLNNESDLDRVLNNELDSDRVFKNVLREDSDDVSKETVKKGIGTLQRNPISGIGPEAVTTSVKKRSRRELVPFEEILHRELVPIGR